jgi:glutamyl-Q tRNA(Asp) synthetase
MAQSCGGRFLLRIEDIDLTRTREEHVAGIISDLSWLGLEWEQPVLRQSARFPAYHEAIERLAAANLVYPCFASRTQIQAAVADDPDPPRDPDGAILLPPTLRRISGHEINQRRAAGEPFALRLDMTEAIAVANAKLNGTPLTFREIAMTGVIETRQCRPERWGDCILQRKDIPASYHLAVVIDDATQGITHVTRGQDLLASTDIHRLLQVLFGLPEPIYHHHALLLAPGGTKLSKSAGDRSLAQYRAAGLTPEDLKLQIGITLPHQSWRTGEHISV